MQYPGDKADPKDVAAYFAEVAKDYGLPGVLPVMTSYVEITSAWTGPGDVKSVPGYLSNVDHCSVGYFQQQADDLGCGTFGWGTRAQLILAPYALRRFCEEAAKLTNAKWHANTTDPESLGRWCQAVQRSAFPDRYAEKGYPAAVELLAGSAEGGIGYRHLGFVDEWAYDSVSGLWVWSDPNLKLKTDASGWLYRVADVPTPVTRWEWPTQILAPKASGSYAAMHPSRWDTVWRSDIEALARKIVDKYDCSANTYWWHPPELGLDDVSIDFWGADGRGYPIGYELGQAIFDEIFNDPNPPWIRYCIWQRWMWVRGSGWESFGTDDFSYHEDHPHFSFE